MKTDAAAAREPGATRPPVKENRQPPVSRLRIACVQANPTVGDLEGNAARVLAWRERFRDTADLVVFSECFVSGYPLGDLVLRPGFLRDVRRAVDGLAAAIADDGGPAILVGAPHEGAGRPFNAAYLIENDGTMQVTFKTRLPNEEIYDEQRTFVAGPMPRPLLFRGVKVGVPICEDFWHGDVSRHLVEQGAEILVVPNGSHFKVGKQPVRLGLAEDVVRRHRVPVIYVNQVGGQDEAVFDGGSFAMSRRGGVLAQTAFEEGAFRVDATTGPGGLDLEVTQEDMYDNLGCTGRYPGRLEAMYLAMQLGLRDYVRKSGFAKVVLGMSGGLDSALSAAVAVDALGAANVLLVRMPSAHTGGASMDDAAEAARLLGARIETIAIAPAVDALTGMLAPLFEAEGRRGRDTTEENVQARARGVTLMGISNALGHMLLTTGNKSEMSVGYATLYGDMAGGFSVLKDCYKTDAFALSRWRNANRPKGGLGPDGPVMPESIITKPPTAELSPGQTDEASLGSYEHLDAVLRLMIEGRMTPRRAAALATKELGEEISPEYAERIARLVRNAQYKRRQAPPGVVLGAMDYGQGWRFPIAGRYSL